jgi:hypothetical protein
MKLVFRSNIEKFRVALRAKAAACNHAYVDILNKAAINVAYKATHFTPKADAGRIRASLMSDPHLRYALVATLLKKKGVGALKSPEFAKAVEKFVSRRASSAGYLRSSWAPAIRSLGGTFSGAEFPGASEGFANKATISFLVAEVVAVLKETSSHKAHAAEDILYDAVQKAINEEADKIFEYAIPRLQTAAAT